jgi:hypothetical protein
MIPNGGPINVAGDLTYFFKLKTLSEESRGVVVTAKKCTVNMRDMMGKEMAFQDQNFSFGPYNKLPTASQRAEWYIVHPQLLPDEQRAFQANFSGAVNIHCDLEYRAAPTTQNCGLGCNGLYGAIREMYHEK